MKRFSTGFALGFILAALLYCSLTWPLIRYRLASYGPGDSSAGSVSHCSDSQARVVTPR